MPLAFVFIIVVVSGAVFIALSAERSLINIKHAF